MAEDTSISGTPEESRTNAAANSAEFPGPTVTPESYQPGADAEASNAVFPDPAVTPGSYQSNNNNAPNSLRIQPDRRLVIGLLVLLLLVLSSLLYAFPLRPRIPAANGFVKITPASSLIADTYTPNDVLGSTDAAKNAIAAHRIAQTTPTQSMTVTATGKTHHDATTAQGNVNVTVQQGQLPSSASPFTTTTFYLTSNSGVKIDIQVGYVVTVSTTGVYSLPAVAQNPGASGNIPAYDIDGTYQSQKDPSLIMYIQNTRPFTGGADARDTSTVQQSDIDTATSTLEDKLNTSATSVKASVQSQLASTEQFMNDIQCNPHVATNHQANDQAPNVTVKVTFECVGIAYNVSKLTDFTTSQLSQSANSQLGTGHYALVGKVEGLILPDTVTIANNGTVTYTLDARGIWVYQVTRALQQHFVSMIEGQPLTDAKILMHRQQGVAAVDIQTSGGLGTALPLSSTNIQVNVTDVKGIT